MSFWYRWGHIIKGGLSGERPGAYDGEWDESKVNRGKTTEASNNGSFAPKNLKVNPSGHKAVGNAVRAINKMLRQYRAQGNPVSDSSSFYDALKQQYGDDNVRAFGNRSLNPIIRVQTTDGVMLMKTNVDDHGGPQSEAAGVELGMLLGIEHLVPPVGHFGNDRGAEVSGRGNFNGALWPNVDDFKSLGDAIKLDHKPSYEKLLKMNLSGVGTLTAMEYLAGDIDKHYENYAILNGNVSGKDFSRLGTYFFSGSDVPHNSSLLARLYSDREDYDHEFPLAEIEKVANKVDEFRAVLDRYKTWTNDIKKDELKGPRAKRIVQDRQTEFQTRADVLKGLVAKYKASGRKTVSAKNLTGHFAFNTPDPLVVENTDYRSDYRIRRR